ncbi:hypothetical protein CXB51_013791 [Gossypium anomalum]|uniref:Uncharacterized protein n=1 Tax=Gossypium anomalum TaxID=47600 RepID=A0A8J6D255_9ROSI|nr:hypothetical protein CXB51_013791 [Gossypium anomalum]
MDDHVVYRFWIIFGAHGHNLLHGQATRSCDIFLNICTFDSHGINDLHNYLHSRVTLPLHGIRLLHSLPTRPCVPSHTALTFHMIKGHGSTVVGSLNVPETLNEPAEFQTESGETRRGRGCMLLKDLYDLNPVEHVKVSRNSHSQPVGSKARLLAGYLGIITRNANMLPINYESWHHMPDSNKNQERFALEVSDDYIKKALGKKWRDHKSTLKKQYFKKDISLEEKLQNVPPRMLRYQWEDVIRFWNSKKGEDCEQVGTSSRQKQKFTHTAGSRSFASVAEAEELSSGQKVGRLQLFEITHRKKDGSPMTSKAGEIMEKLKENKEEYEAIASTDSSVNLENIDNRIITEVLGPERYGQVRFQGSGVTPTQ